MEEHKKIAGYIENIINQIIDYSPRLIGAFLLLFIGLYGIKLINRLLKNVMIKRNLDPTLTKFLTDILLWALRILLFVTFISKLGIETTSFVAILGAMGLAIGLSLQGSLSNFAGGVLIILFKPFKVGDVIEAQGVIASVVEIQIFVTKLINGNNQTVFIPNGTLSNGNIINYSMQGTRRADFLFSIAYDTDLKVVKNIVMTILKTDTKIVQDPAPMVFVQSLSDSGVQLAVRSWAKNENFDYVSTSIIEKIKLAFDQNSIKIQPYVQEKSKDND